MTVGQLLNNIDSRELTEWRAYFKLEAERLKQEREAPVDKQVAANMRGYGK